MTLDFSSHLYQYSRFKVFSPFRLKKKMIKQYFNSLCKKECVSSTSFNILYISLFAGHIISVHQWDWGNHRWLDHHQNWWESLVSGHQCWMQAQGHPTHAEQSPTHEGTRLEKMSLIIFHAFFLPITQRYSECKIAPSKLWSKNFIASVHCKVLTLTHEALGLLSSLQHYHLDKF